MAVIKRICWCYTVIIILESSLCKKDKKMMFEIERRRNAGDRFPRDFTINNKGEWEKVRCPAYNKCESLNALSNGNCGCACKYPSSTFRMGPTARNSTCIGNSKIRSDEGCTIVFQDEGVTSLPLRLIDTSNIGSKIVKLSGITCNTFRSTLYWDYGVWKPLVEDIFSLSNNKFKWKRSTKYSGRIIKQPLLCTNISTSQTIRHCIMFKMAGKLAYDLNRLPTKAPTASSTKSQGTVMTHLPSTTKQPTTKPLTSATTEYETTLKATTKQSTTSKQTTFTHPTHKTQPMSDEPTTTEKNKHSTNEIPVATEKIPTEASEIPTTEATEQSTTEIDVIPGKKGARGASKDSDGGENNLVVATIGTTAAIACVIILCIFLWLVVKRRHNIRSNEAYSTDMTVITNSTGMNNSSAAPTLKNPIYCEPITKQHPKQLPVLGNPVYGKVIVNNNSKKGHQNTKKPMYKPTAKSQSNHYDNKDDDKAFDNPGYQDLVIKAVKDTHATDDNTYAEPEKPIYEALSEANGARDSIYQPLVHNTQGTETTEIPEYLTLLNENTRPEEQEVPEYLTLVGDDKNNPTQPGTGEYDYAFVDGQEKPPTLKAPNTRGAVISKQKPQVYNGPSVNGPPLYDVLEDPSDQGPPVYDVLEDPSDKGPPVSNELGDPNDNGPLVYDILKGPDSGDDYLVPLEPSKK